MTEEQDHTWRSRRHGTDRTRIRRITAGLEEEAETLANGTLVPRRRRLAPAEHWRPAPPDDEQAEEAWPEDDDAEEPVDEWADEPEPEEDEPEADEPVDEPEPEAHRPEPAWPPADRRPEPEARRTEPTRPSADHRPEPEARRTEAARPSADHRPAPQVEAVRPAPPADAKAEAPAPDVHDEAKPAPLAWWRRLAGSRERTASWLDRLLVVIEVLAMLGLVVATFASFGLVDRLTSDLSRLGGQSATRPPATAAPTPTPLPSPSATAVPSGTAQPFGALLPGGRDATPAPTEAAPAASLADAHITIEAIGVDAPIVEGDDWETLKQGVGHHPGTALPGEPGNVVLAAHNDVYGSIFRKLSELREGDAIRIDTQAGTYDYRVTSVRIVLPTETSVLDPAAGPALTLITCYPPLVDTHRVVVTAESVEQPGTTPVVP